MNETYTLIPAGGSVRGPYSSEDLRAQVEELAAKKTGKPFGSATWGWRATPTGAEAVCEHEVIAEAVRN